MAGVLEEPKAVGFWEGFELCFKDRCFNGFQWFPFAFPIRSQLSVGFNAISNGLRHLWASIREDFEPIQSCVALGVQEQLVAFVSLKSLTVTVTEEELMAHCTKELREVIHL